MYIQAPQIFQPIHIIKGKVPRIKKAKWHEVPEFYRKERWIDKVKPYLFEATLYVVGITERIKAIWAQRSKTNKLSKRGLISEKQNANKP